ncbi:hypothetical protein QJS04_geneDACA009704 [Acorus gramineus]|uniref:Uncharacterized protein n=1 Tax=Acorus gramineus TaxID=55184 RepID=A0AAV9B9S7_ACOGR|nr:hypothetical protein QJS04_geneDACA009704 [Acorus gramineus]
MASPAQQQQQQQPPTKPRLAKLFMQHARARKDSYIQLLIMAGILGMSLRSLTQKYRIHALLDDTSSLKDDHRSISSRFNSLRSSLLCEADASDPSGLSSSRLRRLFGDDSI